MNIKIKKKKKEKEKEKRKIKKNAKPIQFPPHIPHLPKTIQKIEIFIKHLHSMIIIITNCNKIPHLEKQQHLIKKKKKKKKKIRNSEFPNPPSPLSPLASPPTHLSENKTAHCLTPVRRTSELFPRSVKG